MGERGIVVPFQKAQFTVCSQSRGLGSDVGCLVVVEFEDHRVNRATPFELEEIKNLVQEIGTWVKRAAADAAWRAGGVSGG